MKKPVLILTSLAFLACSKVGVGYSIGTNQIESRVDDAFDFSRSKSKDVNRFLDSQFDKNKKPVFKKFKELLSKVEDLAQKENITQEEKDQLHQYLLDYQKEMITLFKPSFDKVMQEVGDAEIKNFKEYSSEQISEKKEEASDKKSFKKRKIANVKKVAEFLLGDLTKSQEQQVAKFVDDHLGFYSDQIDMRKNFNEDLIKLYPQKDKMTDLSLAYYAGDNSIRTDEYKKARVAFEVELKSFIFALWDQKNSEQKEFFQKRLKDISHEVDKILIE